MLCIVEIWYSLPLDAFGLTRSATDDAMLWTKMQVSLNHVPFLFIQALMFVMSIEPHARKMNTQFNES